MCAEGVVFDGASPVVVLHGGALILGADAVGPVVFVGEASAWPAEYGYVEGLERFEHVFAVAVDVGYGGVFTHPQASIDAAAQVFGELAVDFFGYFGAWLIGVERALNGFGGAADSDENDGKEQGENLFHKGVGLQVAFCRLGQR